MRSTPLAQYACPTRLRNRIWQDTYHARMLKRCRWVAEGRASCRLATVPQTALTGCPFQELSPRPSPTCLRPLSRTGNTPMPPASATSRSPRRRYVCQTWQPSSRACLAQFQHPLFAFRCVEVLMGGLVASGAPRRYSLEPTCAQRNANAVEAMLEVRDASSGWCWGLALN